MTAPGFVILKTVEIVPAHGTNGYFRSETFLCMQLKRTNRI